MKLILLLLLISGSPALAQRIQGKPAYDGAAADKPFVTTTKSSTKVGLDVNIMNPTEAQSAVSVTNFPSSQAITNSSLTSIDSKLVQFTLNGDRLKVDVPAGASGLTDAELRASAVPVSGTFYQATQPVSGTLTCNAGNGTLAVSGPLTDAQIRATPLPVSGTFYQATQPVSIASMPSTPVTGTFWQSTQPVSGTFWQSTQPVSIASMPSTPVTGTFWQATQPVSGTFWQATQPVSIASMPTTAVTGPLTDAQLRATAVPISGSVSLAQTKATFSVQAGPITPPATPTDMFIINGSATKTVRIMSIELSCTQTTAGINTFYLVKRSTANSGGTSAAFSRVLHDTSLASPSATNLAYSVNPSSTGSLSGNIRGTKILCPAPASLVQPIYTWDFTANGIATPVTLRGVAEGLAVNFQGAALPPGLSILINVTWTEE